jgi:O-antigen/teichoic acid export membrane protein
MLKQKLVLSYLTKIGLQVVSIGVTIVVARIAGASVLGTVAFATSYISMFLIFFDFGQGVAHIKLVSEGQNEKSCNGVFVRIQMIMAIVFFIVTMSFFLITKYVLKKPFESEIHETVVLITIITLSISNLFSIPRTIFIAKTLQARSDLPDFSRQLIYQGLRLLVVLLGYGAIAISMSNLVATLFIIPIYIYLLKGTQFGKWDSELFKKYLLIALPVFLTNIVDYFSMYIDKVLLQFFSNSAEVGYYVAGFSIGGFIALVGNSAGLLLLPTFSKRLAENRTEEVNNMIRQFERFTWVFLFIITLVSSIGSDLIVRFFLGHKYDKSIPILSIINFSSFFITYFMIYSVTLSSKGYFNLSAKLYLAKLIFLIVFAVILVHPLLFNLGSKGLALTLLLSNLFIGILFIFYAKFRIVGLKIIQEKQLILYSILFTIPAYIGYQLFDQIPLKILYLGSVLVCYYLIAYILKIIRSSDYTILIQLLSVAKMGSYIKGEMKNDIN